MAKKYIKKKEKRVVLTVNIHIKATLNNTIVSVTDLRGNLLTKVSAGHFFKGARKSTPFAAQTVGQRVVKSANTLVGAKTACVFISGPGSGRDSVVRAIHAAGMEISFIRDITAIAHNGCRPPKRRRV